MSLVIVSNMCMMGRDNMGSMLQVDSLHRFTGGLGDLVINIRALDFGDNMTVLNLNWNKLHLGVVNTMLSGNLATSVLHFGCHRMSNSMGNWERGNRGSNHRSSRSMSNNRSRYMSNRSRYMSNSRYGNYGGLINKGARSYDQWISFSLSLSFTLVNLMIPIGWLITESFHDFLAHLLILNFLCFYSFSLTNILSEWNTRLSCENFMFCLAFWCRHCVVVRGGKVVGVSFSIRVCYSFCFSFSSRSCTGSNKKTGKSKDLYHFYSF